MQFYNIFLLFLKIQLFTFLILLIRDWVSFLNLFKKLDFIRFNKSSGPQFIYQEYLLLTYYFLIH